MHFSEENKNKFWEINKNCQCYSYKNAGVDACLFFIAAGFFQWFRCFFFFINFPSSNLIILFHKEVFHCTLFHFSPELYCSLSWSFPTETKALNPLLKCWLFWPDISMADKHLTTLQTAGLQKIARRPLDVENGNAEIHVWF